VNQRQSFPAASARQQACLNAGQLLEFDAADLIAKQRPVLGGEAPVIKDKDTAFAGMPIEGFQGEEIEQDIAMRHQGDNQKRSGLALDRLGCADCIALQ
jgi:hypothetical protein